MVIKTHPRDSELERIAETAALSDPDELRLQDVLVLARQLLSRLR